MSTRDRSQRNAAVVAGAVAFAALVGMIVWALLTAGTATAVTG